MKRCTFGDCPASFGTTKELLSHIAKEHNPKTNNSVNLEYLLFYLGVYHFNELQDNGFKCKQCEQVFKLQRYLTRHEKEVHGEQRIFRCDECGSIFHRNFNLKRHCRTMGHAGYTKKPRSQTVRPCIHCGKTFTRKDTLTEHTRRMHLPHYDDISSSSSSSDEENDEVMKKYCKV